MFTFKCGSRKLPKNYMISNMGPANICPAKVRGLCLVCNKYKTCYAERDEITYPAPRPYRKKQMIYWLTNDKETIWQNIDKQLARKKKFTSPGRRDPLRQPYVTAGTANLAEINMAVSYLC